MARPVRTILTPQQYKAISLIIYKDVNRLTNEQIAQEVGVATSTVYRWLQDATFAGQLIKESEEVNKSFLVEAYSTLRALINNPHTSTATKLKAIELVLKNQGRLWIHSGMTCYRP